MTPREADTSHHWTGPITEPSIAKPGMYRCECCSSTVDHPTRASLYCLGADADRIRAELVDRPGDFARYVDLTSVFTDWLLDPATPPHAALDAALQLSAADARAVIADFLIRRCNPRGTGPA